jgi:hypothetical protein
MRVLTHTCSIALCVITALLATGAPARASTIRLTLDFGTPKLETLPGGFSRITFPATIQAGKPGEPSYPFRGVQALLPPGESVSRVNVIRGGWTLIGGSNRLYPAQAPFPGMELDRAKPRFLYRAAAYEIDAWVYPPEAVCTTHFLRGYAIAACPVSPVGYHPASGEVGYYRTADIVLETIPSAEAHEALRLLRTDRETTRRVSRLVANPGDLSRYDGLAPLVDPADAFEYLIITAEQFTGDLAPLRDFYTRRGIRARIMTVEEISASYSGVDTAERIRNAVRDAYINSGITHVLLAGDWDGGSLTQKIVPYRGLYGEVHSSKVYTDNNIPADLYFAALDGTWNDDGDAFWGEPGEDDPYSEVAVGRASVDAADEISHFINKTVTYQDQPVAGDVRSALLLGEKLWDDPLTYGGDEVELLVGTHADNGFTTVGMPADFAITRVYDRLLGAWNKNAVFDGVNDGTNWVAHAGHSNTGYVMRMTRSDADDDSFRNDGITASFPIMCSTGCYDGSFDNFLPSGYYETADCIAEQMVTMSHCAAAFICNSRYGWFTEGTTNGPSIHLMREFFDAVFTEGYTTLGEAHQRSKDETAGYLDLPDEWEPGAVRWCFYASNLLGDPALDAWTDTPESLAAVHPAVIGRDEAVIGIETGIPGSVACLYRNGLCYGRGTADSSGHIDLVWSTVIPDSVDWLELDVRAHNRYVHRDTLAVDEPTFVEAPASAATLEQNAPNPFNPSTAIRYSLVRDGDIDLRVYDSAGREVAHLAHGRASKGAHTVRWTPSGLASGVYFYVLKASGVAITRKAVLLR